MAWADAKRRRVANEIIDWVMLGIRTGARRDIVDYRTSGIGDFLIAAVNRPLRARARINEARRLWELDHPVGDFNVQITAGLLLTGTGVTLADLNAELAALEADANNLITAHRNATMTNDQIATWIETNWRFESADWLFPFPAGYADTW